jgi:hypothetical protein
MREVHMNKGTVGEDRGSKEMDGCPLTVLTQIFLVFALLSVSPKKWPFLLWTMADTLVTELAGTFV